jgi:NAD(P)-dependent dehydrogenase (short-subunit alcohol dehydrogenase family)
MAEPALHALVTGASSGIGRATAVRLSAERRLILHGRDRDRLEETRRLCRDPDAHTVWAYDLEAVEGIGASLGPLLAESGRAVDAFVHCAGMVTVLPMKSVDHAAALRIMRVNCLSAMEIVHLLLKKKLNSQKLASVVFISSIWSRHGARAHAAYCATKAALDGLMRALAVELAPSVRVNSILPGAIETTMAAEGLADPEIRAKMLRDYPLGLGRPEDVARAVAFLLSDEARWITGLEMTVDGGRTANMSLK